MSKRRQLGPSPYDIQVGQRLRQARTLAGMSQGRLGEAVGVTFQQVQKYEKGLNRIGASRLMQFSTILNVTPAYFFDGIQPTDGESGSAPAKPSNSFDYGEASQRQALELVRHFGMLTDMNLRTSILELVKTAARAQTNETAVEASDEAAAA
ncbi:helix-turn-helix transcriptional regulator [Ferrovibrio sp.]|uniref:helix-turn-helix domain-containing protein n=1 Tax=Ferrovibrio sp. TaxID=1917215 RepID=UPI0025B86860|nr:helix-turn-helix transcriptional regulator [Ferrovibrio sp.]MBX3453074.1 helix-turn-helix transcriptional regulator [Ferrovibrio sp.]